jgi:hypothetical protein
MRSSGRLWMLGALVLWSWIAIFAGCNAVGGDVDCPAGQTDCGGFCANLLHSQDHCGACGAACARDEACSNGVCRLWCPAGTTTCDGTCVNLITDNANCGACGVGCAVGECCRNSACSTTCVPGEAVGGGGSHGDGRYDDTRVDHSAPSPSGRGYPH